jgi:hypothetical protein
MPLGKNQLVSWYCDCETSFNGGTINSLGDGFKTAQSS